MNIPRWLLPVVAIVAALAVGVAAFLVGMRFAPAAPRHPRSSRPPTETAQVLAPVPVETTATTARTRTATAIPADLPPARTTETASDGEDESPPRARSSASARSPSPKRIRPRATPSCCASSTSIGLSPDLLARPHAPRRRRARRRSVRAARRRPRRRLPAGYRRRGPVRRGPAAALDERAGVPADPRGARGPPGARHRRALLRHRSGGPRRGDHAHPRHGSGHLDRALLAGRPPGRGAGDDVAPEQRRSDRGLAGRGGRPRSRSVHRRALPRGSPDSNSTPSTGRWSAAPTSSDARRPTSRCTFNSDGAARHPDLELQPVGQNLLLASSAHTPDETVTTRAYLVPFDSAPLVQHGRDRRHPAAPAHRCRSCAGGRVRAAPAQRDGREHGEVGRLLPRAGGRDAAGLRALVSRAGTHRRWESDQADFESSAIVRSADRNLPQLDFTSFTPRDDRTVELTVRVDTVEGTLCSRFDWDNDNPLPLTLCDAGSHAGGGVETIGDRGFGPPERPRVLG